MISPGFNHREIQSCSQQRRTHSRLSCRLQNQADNTVVRVLLRWYAEDIGSKQMSKSTIEGVVVELFHLIVEQVRCLV